MSDGRNAADAALDPSCPWCAEDHGITEAYDGSENRCENCAKPIVCVVYSGGIAAMHRIGRDGRTLGRRTT